MGKYGLDGILQFEKEAGLGGLVTIKIFASLLHWAKEPQVQIPLEGPTPLRSIVEGLRIPEEEVAVVIRNGRQVKLDTEVEPGDTVSLFPVIDGG